jgi:regulator of protease activity HflC (stomatin/prohibitin superfamily)
LNAASFATTKAVARAGRITTADRYPGIGFYLPILFSPLTVEVIIDNYKIDAIYIKGVDDILYLQRNLKVF